MATRRPSLVVEMKPLAISIVDWNSYNEVLKNALDIDIIKAVESNGYSISNQMAFIDSFRLFNSMNPLEHMAASFVGEIDVRDLIVLLSTDLSVAYKEDENCVVVLTATIGVWRVTIPKLLSNNVPARLRKHIAEIMGYLELAGYKLWRDFNQVQFKNELILQR